MPCSRGAVNPNKTTQLRLFGAAANRCQNPGCLDELFHDVGGETVHVAEMAHIVAAADAGPRANKAFSRAARGRFENLILLCPTCHTKIDKQPDFYTDATILGWKRDHQRQLDMLFGAIDLPDRQAVRGAVEPLLRQNRTIFDLYGPNSAASEDPESDMPTLWRAKLLSTTLPNSYRMLAILVKNSRHLNPEELQTVSLFQEHVHDLAQRCLNSRIPSGMRFPVAMNSVAAN
jgi:hypothetical protein